MKTKKKIVAMFLSVVLCMAGSITLFAAVSLPSISSSKPIACYTLKSSGRVYAYTAANLRNKTGGYIDCATDECKLLRISGNAVQVEYPVSSGTRTAWFARSEFSSYNMANGAAKRWTQNKQVTTYRRADGKTTYGYISAGDACYMLSESAGYIQTVYPVSGSYKMGWITKDSFGDSASSQHGSSQNSSNQNSSSQPVPNGLYKVVSMINKQYVWDIYDASTDNGGNLQLWKDNGTNAQKFMFTYDSDGYYTITNANSNKAIDCAGGKSVDGTNIQQYTSNHSNAQKWKVTSAGNGYYTFQCKGNGKMIDVSGGTASNGKNIQLYKSNGSKAQKFALVKTQKKQGTSNTNTSGHKEVSSSALLFPLKGDIRTSSSQKTDGQRCDYKASSGTPVYAPANGKVAFRQSYAIEEKKLASYGNNIVFTSSDGKYEVRCAHLKSFKGVGLKYTSSLSYPCSSSKYDCNTVTLRTKNVKRGDLLGYTGMTGNASGPHLHLEVKKDGKAVNPKSVFQTWN